MSAYMVTNETVSVIAASIKEWVTRSGIGQYILEQYHHGYLDIDNPEFEQRLHGKLVELNALSLFERYGDKVDTSAYIYDINSPVVSIPMLLDLLRCWMYQSCEGVAVESDFYKLIELLAGKLAIEYIGNQRETIWGIDSYNDIPQEDKIIKIGRRV